MSDYFKRNIEYLDENTYIIIHGYFRIHGPSKLIPNDIIHVTILFSDDHLMFTQGTYQWCIDNQALQQMKNSSNRRQRFASDTFKIAEINWQLHAYPNGRENKSDGSFKMYVKPLSLPKEWNYIITRYTILCPETKSSSTICHQHSSSKAYGWRDNLMRYDEIQQLHELSFNVTITVLRIVLKGNE